MNGLPHFLIWKWYYKTNAVSKLEPHLYSHDEMIALTNYEAMMLTKMKSVVDVVAIKPWKYLAVGIHDMSGPDRLGNPDIDFPICIAFGDRDYLGSEGADKIVRNNKYFKCGRSQLIKVEDCTHEMFLDQPTVMTQLLINFFEGDASGRFEVKPTN